MTRSVMREHIFKILFRAEFYDTQEMAQMINSVSKSWPTSRLGKSELTIMRLAVYEIKFDEDIPTNVAINEAVELAKKYGADNAPSFINGVLAQLAD